MTRPSVRSRLPPPTQCSVRQISQDHVATFKIGYRMKENDMRQANKTISSCVGVMLIRAGLVCIACICGSAIGQVLSITVVTSGTNPSVAGQTVGLVGAIRSGVLLAEFPAGVGRSAGTSLYYRYELTDTTFRTQVLAANLSNQTSPGSFANVVIAQGGGVGERFVVFQVTTGGAGVALAHVIRFNVAPDATPVTSAVTYSVHETASSAFGSVAANTARLYGNETKLLSALSPPFVITGTLSFLINGVAVPACTALPVTDAGAQCSNVFATSGTFAVTANYSGNGNFTASSGTLSGGQLVELDISPLTLAGATVATAYSQALTAVGGVLPAVFNYVSGDIPPGLSLSAAGVVSGTPTTAGGFEFFVRVTDAINSTNVRKLSLVVSKSEQTITFNPPASGVVGSSITLTAVASSGLQVVYSISTQSVCTSAGSVLRFIAAGTCVITPLQNGDSNYFAAATTPRAISVLVPGGIQPLRLRSNEALSLTGHLVSNQLQFTQTTDPGVSFRTLGLIDIDGNKSPDLVYQNITQGDLGEVRVWQDVLPANDRVLRSVRLAWRVDAVGDLDGDGFGDIVWRFTGQTPNFDDTGVSYVWFTNGVGVASVRKRGGAPLSWRLLGAADLNADGAADIIYISPNNEIRALIATLGRSCANLSAGVIPAGFSAIKLGSFLRSGRAEILIRNAVTGEVRLVTLDATGLTLPASTVDPNDPNASCTPSALVVNSTLTTFATTEPAWRFFGSADFNGDGLLDIVWTRPDSSTVVWLTTGDNLPLTAITDAGTIPSGFTPIQP